MKFYISADIEGTAGCFNWDQTMGTSKDYETQKQIMTNEVLSCVNAINKNHTGCEILIKDAHYRGDNLDISVFPENCKIIRGWSDNPHSMVQGLDESFDGIFFIGYHNGASTGTSPLSHSFNGSKFQRMTLNGKLVTEFLFNNAIAMHYAVPAILVSGDKGLCDRVKKDFKDVKTVYSYEGIGNSIMTKTPKRVEREIFDETLKATKNIRVIEPLVKDYELIVEYKRPSDCYRALSIPGSIKVNDNTISLKGENILELESLMVFL